MRVLLVFPDVGSFHSIQYHHGLASISAYLKKNGHEVKLEYINSKDQFERVLTTVKTYLPDIVGFTSVETQFIFVKVLSARIKEIYKCVIICGGVYVTLFPEVVKTTDSLDAVIRGEGEQSFLDIVECLKSKTSYYQVKNLAYFDKQTSDVVINPLYPIITDLDTLPFPDRSVFNFQSVIDRHHFVLFYFNRGCPYRCTYCCNHALAHVYGMEVNKMRYRSPQSCIQEIKEVLKNYSFKGMLFFGDDIFVSNKKWLDEFLAIYKKEIHLPFMCELRCNIVSPKIFAKLRDAGCSNVSMGIESGNEFIRNKVMKRGMSNQEIIDAFSWAHDCGIITTSTCVIGLPFETNLMIEETADLCSKVYVKFPGVNIFYPYKGTELWNLCNEWGFLPENIEEIEVAERKESVLNYPHISKSQIEHYYKNWNRLVIKKRSLSYKIKYYPEYFVKSVWRHFYPEISRLKKNLSKIIIIKKKNPLV